MHPEQHQTKAKPAKSVCDRCHSRDYSHLSYAEETKVNKELQAQPCQSWKNVANVTPLISRGFTVSSHPWRESAKRKSYQLISLVSRVTLLVYNSYFYSLLWASHLLKTDGLKRDVHLDSQTELTVCCHCRYNDLSLFFLFCLWQAKEGSYVRSYVLTVIDTSLRKSSLCFLISSSEELYSLVQLNQNPLNRHQVKPRLILL